MRLGQLELVCNRTDASPHQSNLSRCINIFPLVGETPTSPHIVNRCVDQLGSDAAGKRGGGVVLKSNDIYVFTLRPLDRDASGALKQVSKWLDVGVKFIAEACLYTFKNEVNRSVVAGEAKGSVAAVVVCDMVQIPENILETARIRVSR